MPEDPASHLRLCRELYSQLRRILAAQDHKGSAADASLPINLSMFIKNFDLYLKWVERNTKVVDIAVRRPPVRVSESGDIA